MNYTDYGLTEGLTMLILPIAFATLLAALKFSAGSKPFRKQIILIYLLVIGAIALDTLMWVFSIETNIIDFKVTTDAGSTEQITLFTVAFYILFIYLIMMKDKTITKPHIEQKDK